MEHILHSWLHILSWMVGLGITFAVLAHFMPCNPGMYWWKNRRQAATDLGYWFIIPLFLGVFRQAMLFWGAALVIGLHDKAALKDFFLHGYGPLAQMPLLLQCVLILLGQDVLMYWIHRAFHLRHAWPFHAVHHSTTTLDWISTQRFHPVNNLLEFTLADVLALMCGFSPAALLLLGPFNTVYSAMVHANLNWTFGPFKYVFASPVFHRWHHTGIKEGGMSNFAPTFPFLDVLFGTFYMPEGKLPRVYGVNIPDFPDGFWGQMVYPFLKKNYD